MPFMVFVGLMGGASYVNVNYIVLQLKEIGILKKELAMNILEIFITLGITLASLFVLLVSTYIIPN